MTTPLPHRPLRSAAPGLLLALLAACAALAGCGGSSGRAADAARTGRATITVVWPQRSRLIPDAANSIRVDIRSSTQVVASQLLARPAAGGSVTVTFDPLPTGDLAAAAYAYPQADGSGTAQAQSSVPLHIDSGQTTSFTITMASTISEIDLTPSALNLVVHGTIPVTPTAKDASGAVVLISPAKGQWTSDDPAIASVDAQGTVTGVANGTTTIRYTDTESGKIGTASATVTGGGGPIGFGSIRP